MNKLVSRVVSGSGKESQMIRKVFRVKSIVLLAIAVFAFTAPSLWGEAFALRTLNKGDQVKDYELTLLDGSKKKLSELMGEKGILVVFWATWSDRSRDLLSFMKDRLVSDFKEKGIEFLAINVEHQDISGETLEQIKSFYQSLNMPFPTAIDEGLVLFDEFGVVANPTTVLISKDFKVVDAFPGFPSVAKDEIPGMLRSFLGIKEEKKPEEVQYLIAKKPKNHALLYYNLGKTLFKRYVSLKDELKRVPKRVIAKLDEASKRDPSFYGPYMLKAIIYHKAGEEEARDEVLKKIDEMNFTEHVERRDLAYMFFLLGMFDRSEELLDGLKKEIPGEPTLHLLDAMLAEVKGDENAGKLFLSLLEEKLPFDISSHVDPESGKIVPEEQKDKILRYFAEKVLGISKK